MLRYLLAKLAAVPLGVFVVVTFAFFLVRIIPGDPTAILAGELATESAQTAIRERWGLDQPLPVQFTKYWWNFLTGDLGVSISSSAPVFTEIARVIPHTIILTTGAALLALALCIPLAMAAAARPGSWIDRAISTLAITFYSAPIFWLSTLLLIGFSLRWRVFPVAGAGNLRQLGDLLIHLFLPALALGLQQAGLYIRVLRASLIDVDRQLYIRTAKGKGLGRWAVVRKHSLKNAAIPLLTVVGMSVGALIGGAILTETIFARPGLGRLLVNGILARDYPLIQGGLAVFGALFITLNVVVDLLYPLFDPRIEVA